MLTIILRWDFVVRLTGIAAVLVLAACATPDISIPGAGVRRLTAAEGRALVTRLLPDGTPDRAGWATDIYAAIASLDLPPTIDNVCAIIAINEQESSLRADPSVPGLATIAWRQIERERERAGIPKLVLDAALALPSPTGRSYRERIDAARTERELSDIFDDFIGMVPLGRKFLADRNPVRTGGPMQVSIAFAEAHAARKPYPYPAQGSIRHEVFTRRGGVYFGTAHLLDYPVSYDRMIYRFADYNAGWYASRNAAFQNAITQLSGIPLALDGDLLRYEGDRPAAEAGSTELATRVVARRIGMTDAAVRHDLELSKAAAFEETKLYTEVFALADRTAGARVQRAALPRIKLQSPKITRELTTEWFATRVERRFQTCRAREGGAK